METIQDCEAIYAIDERLNISSTKLAQINAFNIPLSDALYRTLHQNLSAFIVEKYRKAGHQIPI